MEEHHQVPIWLFIGAVLLIYGLIILGTGIYGWFVPPEHPVALHEYHADIWWGGLLIVIGAIYCIRFRPFRRQ